MRFRRRRRVSHFSGVVVELGMAKGIPIIYLPEDSDAVAERYVAKWIEAMREVQHHNLEGLATEVSKIIARRVRAAGPDTVKLPPVDEL